MKKPPQAGLMDLMHDPKTYRQAQRDAAAVDILAHIAAGIDALVAIQQESLRLQHENLQASRAIAAMLTRGPQPEGAMQPPARRM